MSRASGAIYPGVGGRELAAWAVLAFVAGCVLASCGRAPTAAEWCRDGRIVRDSAFAADSATVVIVLRCT